MHLNLAYSVAATRRVICLGGVCGPHAIAEANQIEYFFLRLHELLFQALNLNFLGLILQNFQCFMVVQQVVQLAPVYLVHGYGNREVSLVLLEVGYAAIEQIMNGRLLQPLHSVRLSRAGLAIREYSDYALVEDQVNDWLDGVIV